MWIVPISILHQLALVSLFCLWLFHLMIPASSIAPVLDATFSVDCKTVRIFANSGTREQSNKRSGMRLKTVRLLRHALPISLLILRKKTRLFCSLLFLLSPKGFHLRELSLTNIFTRTVKAIKCLHTKGNVYSILRLIKYDFLISFSLLCFGSFIVLSLLLDLFHSKPCANALSCAD